MSYKDFLARKRISDTPSGHEPTDTHPMLFDFQRDITKWAVRRGRAAIFADCGLGKTLMQLEWARQAGTPSLIVTPLSVAQQTIAEAARIGIELRYVTAPTDDPFQVTNYQRIRTFAGHPYRSIVLDESSILKSIDGKTREMLLRDFGSIPYRLCCTATPAPNDLTELGQHAQFLGVMSFREMSATFFVKESNGMAWRLKGHAEDGFYRWLASWAVYVRKPSDLDYPDDGFLLPPLSISDVRIESGLTPAGRLFPGMDPGIQGRTAARRASLDSRVTVLADSIAGDDQWIVWCGLNDEGRKLHGVLNGQSVLIEGNTPDEDKLRLAGEWQSGQRRVLISKPSIYGHGMNWQHCHRVAFLGLGDSYEQYYQAIRRCWRFGQKHPVDVLIVTTETEADVVENVKRKERQAETIAARVVESMAEAEIENVRGLVRSRADYRTGSISGKGWTVALGDSVDRLSELADESVHLSVYSPPFVSLYTYTATERDIGNSAGEDLFFEHYGYVIDQLFRATKPGRLSCVHVAQIPAMLVRDGYIGMKDFRGRCIQEHADRGWVYHGEVVIDKDPQAQAIRTKSKGLLFVQLEKDSSWLRPALADYILVFRKPGDNATAIKPDLTREEWIEWARPIWYGIRESDTLQYRDARSEKDERHICPLQLGTIERCVRLWSNVGDLVVSPFAGIGSEGFVSVKHGRLFWGCELKPEYHAVAVRNMQDAEQQSPRLF